MSNIYELITTEETNYQSRPHNVTNQWDWNMADHINLSILYKNSVFSTGKNDDKPFKNIVLPIITLQYTAEDFNVKDIELFVNDADEYYKSFILRKYHDKWALDNNIDTFIDELVESYVDFGGALVKNVNSSRPEVVKLQTIAFCDQGNLLGGTLGIKHSYSPDQLKDIGTESGWGDPKNGATGSLDDVIRMATEDSTTPVNDDTPNKTVGKNIEVYEVHGTFEDHWVTDEEYEGKNDDLKYSRQLHIVTFYRDKDNKKHGICLFKGREDELPFKLVLRDEIYNRALGRGGIEELFEPQVWLNWNEIIAKEMLEAASKVIHQTSDTEFTTRNNTKDVDQNEVWVHEEGKPLTQVNTTPMSLNLFNNKINEWELHAKQLGFANDALLGVSPTSGTPFALQDLVVQTGRGPHERRKGKLATFVAEIYRDWVIPYMAKEIVKGTKFMTELSLDELEKLAEDVTNCVVEQKVKDEMLNGNLAITQESVDAMKQKFKAEFMSKGERRFFEILKDEFKDLPLEVRVNIAGKQYDLAEKVKKLSNVIRQVIATPQLLQDPQLRGWFNEILEGSGLSPFKGSYSQIQNQNPQISPQQAQPAGALALTQ